MTCEKCDKEKAKHHRDMETRRYSDPPGGMMVIPNRLCVKLINDKGVDAETRSELRDWFVDA